MIKVIENKKDDAHLNGEFQNNNSMAQKIITFIAIGLLSAGILSAQKTTKEPDPYYRCYVGSSAFLLGNLSSNSPSYYQLNFGYRITPKDVISLEVITWKLAAPVGIPYGPSYGDESENYPGSVREYGLGIVYQRYLWKGLYSSLQILPLRRIYLDINENTIQKGFRLFSTFRVGYHFPLWENRFFIEPSIACTFWPISTNVPQSFAEKDNKWNKFFLFEPGFHFGVKF